MNDIQQLTLGVNTNLGPTNLPSSTNYNTIPTAGIPSPATVPAAAAMAADPFGAPAAPAADGREQDRALTLAQTVESLRPTGRRALGIELPLNGTAHHFSKLKDHAVLDIEIKRIGDPKTTSRLLCLAGGLLLWAGIGWKLKRRSQAV